MSQCRICVIARHRHHDRHNYIELDNFMKLSVLATSCGGCNCNIASKLEKHREEEKVHQFLMGLDDVSYDTVHSNILAADPIPSLNRVYGTLVQEERMKIITRSKEERGGVVGLTIQAVHKKKGRGEPIDKSICSHCSKSGHDAKGCFELIGYPEWWSKRPRNGGRTSGKSQQRNGPAAGRGKGAMIRANAAQVTRGSASDVETEKNELAGPTDAQWQTLVEMLKPQKSNEHEKMMGKSSCELWIIDTDASNHMTGNLTILSEERTIQGCPHFKFLAAINTEQERTYFAEAVRDVLWRKAMEAEIEALQNNGTWTIASLPPGKKALGCKWVYKIKYNSDGTIE
ncbi:hypothetical protein L195_g004761 [Trifolium pratense]|uniref:Reverse transcriptase Ty1/copia-type domain-containing protein n=1 Tax=Trifolium pratense TaxID=57577 RepID=A0A2K3NYX9_TRIPR|nr:hypothetical protein L195_g004761 [Trifolium pratense]